MVFVKVFNLMLSSFMLVTHESLRDKFHWTIGPRAHPMNIAKARSTEYMFCLVFGCCQKGAVHK